MFNTRCVYTGVDIYFNELAAIFHGDLHVNLLKGVFVFNFAPIKLPNSHTPNGFSTVKEVIFVNENKGVACFALKDLCLNEVAYKFFLEWEPNLLNNLIISHIHY